MSKTKKLKGQDKKLYSELEKRNLELENEIASLKILENKLKESEEKFRSFIEQSSEGIILVDGLGIIIECNKAMETITGLKTEQIIGFPLWELQLRLMPPGSDRQPKIEIFKELMPEVTQTGKSNYFDRPFIVNILSSGGEYKTILQSVFPVKTSIGFHMGSIFNDITDRARAEDALIREQYLSNSLSENTPDNIYFKDRESRFIRINNTLANRFGLNDPQEAKGKTDFDFFDEEHARKAFDDEQRIISTGEPIIGLEEREVWPDGHISWVSTTKMPLKDKAGEIIGIMGVSRDITENKLAKNKLFTLASRQEAILSAVPEIITEVNNEKVYTWANKAGIDFFGENVIGKEASYYFEGEQDTYKIVQPAFEGDENVIYTESWQRNKNGGKRLLAWWCRVLKDENGEVTGALSTARDITERKKAEEELKNSEARYRYLFEQNPVPMLIYELESLTILAVNDGFIAHYGYSKTEALKLKLTDLFPEPEKKAIAERSLKLQGHVFVGEWHHLKKDGTPITIAAYSHEFSYEGRTARIGVIYDITERKQTEEIIEKERSLLRTLIDNLPAGIFVKDKDYHKIIINPKHEKEVRGHLKYLGLEAETDILGKTDFEVFPEELAKEFFADDQKVIRDGSIIFNTEGIGYYENGSQQWMLVSKIPLYDKNNEITGMIGVTTDITDRRHAEEALRVSEEKFRTIFDNANDGMFLVDPVVKKFIVCNTACLKMLGYSGDEFLNLDISSILLSEELPLIFEEIEKVYGEIDGIRADVKFKRKDNTIFTADLSPTFVTIAEKKLVLVIFRDITGRLLMETELRSAKEKAEESDILKTAFLQNISHEIRTPLNGIIGFSDIITSTNLSPEKREQFSNIIRTSGDQLISIVDDIVVMAAIETGQEKLKEKETNINNLLHIIKSKNAIKAETKNLSFSVTSTLSENEANVVTDEAKLLQILTNLVSNAIKFTSEGSIKVNCRLDGKWLKFAVEDTGIGIPPEMHEKIFGRFFQIDFGETRLYGGTGLGLAVVKSYIVLLKGEIHLDSIPGKGSTFYFTLPYKPVIKEDRPVGELPIPQQKDFSGRVILIAEDDDSNYDYLEAVLEENNLKIIRAKNGQEAVEFCKADSTIEMVLMDIKMPVLNGYEATKQILKIRKDLPIIAQTAYAFPADKQNAFDSGCVDYITKPINSDQITILLNKHLK